jgi:hypothetical protein
VQGKAGRAALGSACSRISQADLVQLTQGWAALGKAERSNPGKRKKDLRGAVPRKSDQLRDAGISKDQTKTWEKLAAVLQAEFDAALADRTRHASRGRVF